MKYYIAYKFKEADHDKLKEQLSELTRIFENNDDETFIFFRDVQDWGNIRLENKEIIDQAFSNLADCDVFFALVDNPEKSEGLLLEAGYAKALKKKIIIAIRSEIDLRFLRAIADQIIEFETFSDLTNQLPIA